jgi:Domain of unknown function (DUF4232)
VRAVGVSLLLIAVVAGGTATAAARDDAPCRARALRGSFAAVPGSAGAGNIVYALRVRNAGIATCTLTGLPQLRLVDARHRALPTHVTAAHPGQLTAILVRVAPGGWASASARFSPDVPGPGEGNRRQCEPTARAVRVTAPGGGTALLPVKPATPVCEHGSMSLSAWVAGRRAPNT